MIEGGTVGPDPGAEPVLDRLRRPSFGALAATALVLIEIAFLAWIPQFVTVDAASHVGGAALIRDVLRGDGGLHLEYVQMASFPAPNLLPEFVLALVMLVLDPLIAEKFFQVVYVVALPLALLYAIRGVRPASSWLVVLALPMTFTFTFLYGFYDFSFGVVLFLVAAGYVWRRMAEPDLTWRAGVAFGALAALVYLTHLVGYLELVLFVGTIGLWRLAERYRSGRFAAVGDELRRRLPLLLGLAPSLAFALVFLVGTSSGLPAHWYPILREIAGVLSLELGIATMSRFELVLSALLAVSLLALSLIALRTRLLWRPDVRWPRIDLRAHDALLFFTIVAAAAAMLAPSDVASGGSCIPQRLTLFPVYGLALWLAGATLGDRVARAAVISWAAIAIGLFAVRMPTFLDLSRTAEEYISVAPCLTNGATMVQVNLSLPTSGSLDRTDPFTEEAGRLSALTRGHDLGNFEGSFPFFLFRNRPENDPFTFLATSAKGFEAVPPEIDLDAYAKRPDGNVDQVIVFGRPDAEPETLASAAWTRLSAQLATDYRLAAVSKGGLVEVYSRTNSATGSTSPSGGTPANQICR